MVIDSRRRVSRDLGFDARLGQVFVEGQDDDCRGILPPDDADLETQATYGG